MAKRKVNIKDVAARADVHPSTVSRVMNPETRSMVSERVAERVTRIAGEMGYTRSPLASGLRTGRSFTIGVIIPDLSNPMFPPSSGASNALWRPRVISRSWPTQITVRRANGQYLIR